MSRYPLIPSERILEIFSKNFGSGTEFILRLLETENRKYSEREQQEKFLFKCQIPNCPQTDCFYFHTPKQRRRPLFHFNYQCKPCFNVYINQRWGDPTICPKGEYCDYCHTENELFHYLNPMIPRVMTVRPDIQVPQKSQLKVFFPRNEHMTEEIEILSNKIRTLRKEIDARRNDVDIKSRQIPIIEENIMKLKGLLLCCKCNMRIYEYINEPCGHVMCENCARTGICARCGNPAQIFKINN